MNRGQTTIDFAIGASIMLVALVFVFAFVPDMFGPFAGNQEHALVADRSAERLSADTLGQPNAPYVLNETCTVEFFAGVADPRPGCRYGTTDLEAVLGLGQFTTANVTVERDGTTAVVGGERLAAGEQVSDSRDVSTARRIVRIGSKTYTLHVKVW